MLAHPLHLQDFSFCIFPYFAMPLLECVSVSICIWALVLSCRISTNKSADFRQCLFCVFYLLQCRVVHQVLHYPLLTLFVITKVPSQSFFVRLYTKTHLSSSCQQNSVPTDGSPCTLFRKREEGQRTYASFISVCLPWYSSYSCRLLERASRCRPSLEALRLLDRGLLPLVLLTKKK